MARESDFIDKLANFTQSLEDLVDILKEQQKSGPSEAMNKLLENIDGETIANIARDLKDVKETTININKNVEKTLKVVESMKKEKETGLFGDVDDKKNKNKIVDGVKTIMLIAGGVLAIGLAFKIIGKVDFLSVVALGMGIMFVAIAFSKVATLKDDKGKPLSYKQIITGAATLVIMSGAILVSGLILKMLPELSIGELLTVVGIGLGMGIATYLLLKGIGGLSTKQLAMAPLVPLIIPVIALGLVLSGYILQQMPTVGFTQIISALGVSIALVPITLAFGFLAKSLEKSSMKDIVMAGIAVPIMAAGVLAASYILQNVADIPLSNVIKAGLGIGLATLAMIPTIWALNKAGLLKPSAIMQLLIAGAAIIIISTAIMASSWILSVGKYDGNFPGWEWSLGVGLAILAFSIPMALIGLFAMSGVGIPALALALIAVPIVAITVALVSHLLAAGNYGVYPNYDWSLGVGLSLMAFGLPMMVLGAFIFATFGLGLGVLASGMSGVLMIASAIRDASYILGEGKYGVYPTFEWARGVALGITAFSSVLVELTKLQMLSSFFGGPDIDLAKFIKTIAIALVVADQVFNAFPGAFSGNYPSEDWARGVGISIRAFSGVLIELTKLQMLKDMMSFFSFGLAGGGDIDLEGFIISVSNALVAAGTIFSDVDKDVFGGNYPSEEWALGVGGSVKAFAEALQALDDVGIDTPGEVIGAMKSIAYGVIAVGNIFTKYGALDLFNIDMVPSEEWALGVGGSIAAFAEALSVMDKALDVEDPNEVIPAMMSLATGLVNVGWIFTKYGKLNLFDTSTVPNTEWSDSVGAAISNFAQINDDIDSDDWAPIMGAAFNILLIAFIFSKLNKIVLPSVEWVDGFNNLLSRTITDVANISKELMAIDDFGNAMMRIRYVAFTMYKYAEIMNLLATNFGAVFESGGISSKIATSIETIVRALPNQKEIDPMWSLIKALYSLSAIPWKDLFKVDVVSRIIGELSKQLKSIDDAKVDSLAKLGASLHIMALVDQTQLKSTLDAIEAKSKSLSEIMDGGSFIGEMFDKAANMIAGPGGSVEKGGTVEKAGTTDDKKSFEDQLLQYVKNIDVNIEKMSSFSEDEKEEKLKAKDVEDK